MAKRKLGDIAGGAPATAAGSSELPSAKRVTTDADPSEDERIRKKTKKARKKARRAEKSGEVERAKKKAKKARRKARKALESTDSDSSEDERARRKAKKARQRARRALESTDSGSSEDERAKGKAKKAKKKPRMVLESSDANSSEDERAKRMAKEAKKKARRALESDDSDSSEDERAVKKTKKAKKKLQRTLESTESDSSEDERAKRKAKKSRKKAREAKQSSEDDSTKYEKADKDKVKREQAAEAGENEDVVNETGVVRVKDTDDIDAAWEKNMPYFIKKQESYKAQLMDEGRYSVRVPSPFGSRVIDIGSATLSISLIAGYLNFKTTKQLHQYVMTDIVAEIKAYVDGKEINWGHNKVTKFIYTELQYLLTQRVINMQNIMDQTSIPDSAIFAPSTKRGSRMYLSFMRMVYNIKSTSEIIPATKTLFSGPCKPSKSLQYLDTFEAEDIHRVNMAQKFYVIKTSKRGSSVHNLWADLPLWRTSDVGIEINTAN